jgi:hypothetical protein
MLRRERLLRPERRQTPRTALERLASINIEPNNGGIILNVSGEGLCFHSIAPVEKSGRVRFSLLENNRRIDAGGELAWMDDVQKVGGLRFTTLPVEAREQIHNWIRQPGVLLDEHEESAGALPGRNTARFDPKTGPASSVPLAAALLRLRARIRLSGFSGGFATGLLISLLATSLLLFHAYRRQFGESLIHWGERLAAKSEAPKQPVVTATALRAELPAKQTVPQVRAPILVHPIPAQPPRKLVPPFPNPVKPQQSKIQAPLQKIATPSPMGPAPQHPTIAGAGAISSTPPPISMTAASSGLVSNPAVEKLSTPRKLDVANSGSVANFSEGNAGSTSQMYFELGRFKDPLLANNTSDQLAHLGFHGSVIQKGHLWMNSYYVLVGPYRSDEEASGVRKNLLSRGYKPRPFERGSRGFLFGSAVTLNGTKLPVGDFTISWESYVVDAKVKFVKDHEVLATTDGKWVKRPNKYQQDEFVYVKHSDGSRNLIEIHFSGMTQALVFGKAS